MNSRDFIKAYENGLATQSWENLDALISDRVAVTFSDGTLHAGKDKVKAAFEHNFAMIKSEKYKMKNINWLIEQEQFAVYTFEFFWSGIINQKSVSGNGVGTSVIIKEESDWKLLTEHLGKKTT